MGRYKQQIPFYNPASDEFGLYADAPGGPRCNKRRMAKELGIAYSSIGHMERHGTPYLHGEKLRFSKMLSPSGRMEDTICCNTVQEMKLLKDKGSGRRRGSTSDTAMLGRKFGRTTARKRASSPPDDPHHDYWHCECECGNKHIARGYYLRKGITQSCGCLVRDHGLEKFVDRTGKTINGMVVVRRARGNDGPQARWHCRCKHCGRPFVASARNIENQIGCGKCKASRLSRDLSGRLFGTLVAEDLDKYKRKRPYKPTNKRKHPKPKLKSYLRGAAWRCRCLCGTKVVVLAKHLVNGQRKRCGPDCPLLKKDYRPSVNGHFDAKTMPSAASSGSRRSELKLRPYTTADSCTPNFVAEFEHHQRTLRQLERKRNGKKPNRRDKYCYERMAAGDSLKGIREAVNARQAWDSLDTDQGVSEAAKRYATIHGKRWPVER